MTMGKPTMTAAEVEDWETSIGRPTRPGKFAGGLQKQDHIWKTAGAVVRKQRVAQSQVARTPCVEGSAHHWVIGAPNGTPVVVGTCKRCGAVREYLVSPEDLDGTRWYRDGWHVARRAS